MSRQTYAVSLLLFGSGLCALVYQTVWLREFRLIFGASTAATAAVLGIFMGGLGVGSLVLGGRAEKSKQPLRFYGNLEALIALTAATTPFLVDAVRHLYFALGGSTTLGPTMGTVVRLALSAVVLGLPTLLMGGTLPAAARSVVRRDDAARRGLAVLYGINTLGAVTGAVLSTFVALEAFGNRRTLWLACLINALVALIARRLASTFPVPDDEPQIESEPSEGVPSAPAPVASPSFVLAAAAIVGFAFLLMELVWGRMLSPLLGGSAFTFGLILAVALFGIGLGGALYAVAGQRRGATLPAFAWTCALEALAVAIPFALGDRLAILAAHLHSLASVSFAAHVFGWFIVTGIVVLPAAVIAGYQFPLLVALLGRGGHGVAKHTARAYALNTAGAIAGSLAGGFGLMPLLTAPGVWKLIVVVLMLLSVAALLRQRSRGLGLSHVGAVLIAVGATALLFALGPTAVWRHSGIGVGRSELSTLSRNAMLERMHRIRFQMIWEAEGVESSVGISASHGASFVINGKSDGNIRADAGTQVMGGLVGAALKPDIRSACVIGLGTGSTAGWLAAVPEIERVDVMELEPAILRMAKICEVANQHVLDNPKCHVLLGDARELLITSRQQYDLIFSEPSNPYRAGIAGLFTTEFYQTARTRLNSGGLFLQWVQSYEVEGDAIRMILATLAEVFPQVEVWSTQLGDLLLVAGTEPHVWNAEQLQARLQTEPFKTATSRIWGVDSAEGFFAHFAAGSALARRIAELPDVGRNTDDNTKLEFAFAHSVGHKDGFRFGEMIEAARMLGASRPNVRGVVDWARVSEEQLAMFTYEKTVVPLASAAPPEVLARNEIRRLVEANQAAAAGRIWLAQKPAPLNPRDTLTFAEALAELGSEEAIPFLAQLRTDRAAEAATLEALLLIRQNRPDEAAKALLAAFEGIKTDPWPTFRVQFRAFDLAVEIANARPQYTAAFFGVIKAGPFPGYLMETARRQLLLRLELRRWRSGEVPTNIGYSLIEPWSFWTEDYLRTRYTFYTRTGLGDAERAREDLEDYLEGEPASFSRGIPTVVPPE